MSIIRPQELDRQRSEHLFEERWRAEHSGINCAILWQQRYLNFDGRKWVRLRQIRAQRDHAFRETGEPWEKGQVEQKRNPQWEENGYPIIWGSDSPSQQKRKDPEEISHRKQVEMPTKFGLKWRRNRPQHYWCQYICCEGRQVEKVFKSSSRWSHKTVCQPETQISRWFKQKGRKIHIR